MNDSEYKYTITNNIIIKSNIEYYTPDVGSKDIVTPLRKYDTIDSRRRSSIVFF